VAVAIIASVQTLGSKLNTLMGTDVRIEDRIAWKAKNKSIF
jgi:hypothetical protein